MVATIGGVLLVRLLVCVEDNAKRRSNDAGHGGDAQTETDRPSDLLDDDPRLCLEAAIGVAREALRRGLRRFWGVIL
jgi:hypothetical protein